MMSSSRRMSVGTSKDQTRVAIEQMEAEREARRRAFIDQKKEKAKAEKRNIAAGNPGDVDFIGLVRKWRTENESMAKNHYSTMENLKICICVRKRPVNDKERKRRDHDSVTCLHPSVWVHSAKFKVDGITKYLDNNSFGFDYAFDETSTTEDVYKYSAMPLVEFFCNNKDGRATVFAYGQTGSGKTHTMSGIQSMLAEDLFLSLSGNSDFSDETGECATLHNAQKLKILEDGKGEVVVTGLEEYEANSPEDFLSLLERGNRHRTTFATEANETSSRSHAICQVLLRDKSTSKLRGKLSLVDLAGSERGADSKSHNRDRQAESSEINKSLLALKECIRALDTNSSSGNNRHVPYRGSKLTQVLKDCFTHNLARTTMIATVSPGSSSADHTLNTLRYADRIKEKKVDDMLSPSNGYNNTSQHQSASKLQHKHQSIRILKTDSSPSPLSDNISPREVDKIDLVSSEELNIKPNKNISKSKPPHSPETIEKPNYEEETDNDNEMDEYEKTVQAILELEENLLNTHMTVIQENVQLLSEEGQLLQSVQGDDVPDYDIDKYAARLGCILDRKTHLISSLQEKISNYRAQVQKEEDLGKKIDQFPEYQY